MPIADQGEDKNQHCDDEHAGRFQGVDMRLGMPFGGRRLMLPLWTGGGHAPIVAPRRMLNYASFLFDYVVATRQARDAYRSFWSF